MPDRQTNTVVLYYDDEGTTPSFSVSPTVTEVVLSSSKYLSGVRYYDIGDTFLIAATLQDIFNISHLQSIMDFDGSEIGYNNFSLNYNDGSLSGVSTPPDDSDTPVLALTKALDKSNVNDIDARLGITLKKPYVNSSKIWTPSQNRLILTYLNGASGQSTEKIDYFTDEYYRLPDNDGNAYPNNYASIPGAISGVWDSSKDLTTYGWIEGLIFNGSFLPANHNFSSGYLPSQSVDYSSISSPEPCVRAFRDSGTPHGNGTLKLSGLTYSDIQPSGNTKVEIRLPTQTSWMDLGRAFGDGNGCHDVTWDGSSDEFGWTAGGASTASSGWMVIVRITHKNKSAKPITLLQMKSGAPSW